MRRVAELLRLKVEAGLTNRQIARSCGIGRATVADYLDRAQRAGLGWPLPDMDYVHTQLRRPHVTLQLVWEEYRSAHPDGYAYTQFCEYYKRWRAPLEVTLRQTHTAGDKTFLDWAGDTLHWVDPDTGELLLAYLFVAVLGASNYTFAQAYPDQQLARWIDAHVDACEYFAGASRIWVPDNPLTAVTKPCYYEPTINASYQELADHYGTAILPARVAHPRDKPKVESAVLVAERQILARLRDQTFFSLAELNAAVRRSCEALNERPFKKLRGCRRLLFEELERPLLHPLPVQRYELGEWRRAKVNIDYHVQVDWHFYSVPYTLTGQEVEVRLAAHTVELFHRGRRVAAHVRSSARAGFTTEAAHRPKAHQKHLEWSPGRLVDWAASVGPQCGAAGRAILESKPHPEQGYRACLGLMRLGRDYGTARLETACQRALALDICGYRSIHQILKAKLDQQPPPAPRPAPRPVTPHANIRGQGYYQTAPAPGSPEASS